MWHSRSGICADHRLEVSAVGPNAVFADIHDAGIELVPQQSEAKNVQRPRCNASYIPARVLSERTSLSNCAKAASTPSINVPVDVSSIGSVADRSEMPRDFRCERSAK